MKKLILSTSLFAGLMHTNNGFSAVNHLNVMNAADAQNLDRLKQASNFVTDVEKNREAQLAMKLLRITNTYHERTIDLITGTVDGPVLLTMLETTIRAITDINQDGSEYPENDGNFLIQNYKDQLRMRIERLLSDNFNRCTPQTKASVFFLFNQLNYPTTDQGLAVLRNIRQNTIAAREARIRRPQEQQRQQQQRIREEERRPSTIQKIFSTIKMITDCTLLFTVSAIGGFFIPIGAYNITHLLFIISKKFFNFCYTHKKTTLGTIGLGLTGLSFLWKKNTAN